MSLSHMVILSLTFYIHQYKSATLTKTTQPNGEIWLQQSESDLNPTDATSYNTIALGQIMSIEFDFIFNGRTNPPPQTQQNAQAGYEENFFRIGYESTNRNCDGEKSSYPAMFLTNYGVGNMLDIKVSSGTTCPGSTEGRLEEYGVLNIGVNHYIKISFNNSQVIVHITGGGKVPFTKNWARDPTPSNYLGDALNVYFLSDTYYSTPYNRGDATFNNIIIKSGTGSSFAPTPAPTAPSTPPPSVSPTQSTLTPSFSPTKNPSENPTQTPTISPTNYPTSNPTSYPSLTPSNNPSTYPSVNPTNYPTLYPTKNPTVNPTINPSVAPSLYPSTIPSNNPSTFPSVSPTNNPSIHPTNNPSIYPTLYPTTNPSTSVTTTSVSPTPAPTLNPTNYPSTSVPSSTLTPTNNPTPTLNPTTSVPPSTLTPTNNPSSVLPSSIPSKIPSASPTVNSDLNPSLKLVFSPTQSPLTDGEIRELTTESPGDLTRNKKQKSNQIQLTIADIFIICVSFGVLVIFCCICCGIRILYKKEKKNLEKQVFGTQSNSHENDGESQKHHLEIVSQASHIIVADNTDAMINLGTYKNNKINNLSDLQQPLTPDGEIKMENINHIAYLSAAQKQELRVTPMELIELEEKKNNKAMETYFSEQHINEMNNYFNKNNNIEMNDYLSEAQRKVNVLERQGTNPGINPDEFVVDNSTYGGDNDVIADSSFQTPGYIAAGSLPVHENLQAELPLSPEVLMNGNINEYNYINDPPVANQMTIGIVEELSSDTSEEQIVVENNEDNMEDDDEYEYYYEDEFGNTETIIQ